ncbi:NADH-quinone oxidoreductase subunit J family protein [Flavobacterium soyangense]|uniref:NADH-quinone oxidoreductase subunit J n=1 Tax=Flavobacterium soyangense TaxID=2023265 RepID=A0A930XVV6_9FLAO|nr:NADH-quinone oxidoreductase subunit J [Flavobacterium soyangense]MBF2708706.1 NADH-quinone oxidoreductase subunit J [Flavobacterium soyangense]
MEKIVFYILALIMIVAAIASVTSRQMLRSVIYLLFVLIGVAGIYFLIDYNFLAAVQLTVYAGGIIVLVIFSVLLVHHIEMELEMAKLSKKLITGLVCLIGLGVFLSVIYSTNFNVVENSKTTDVSDIGMGLLSYGAGGFILPFEVISILLLAAMIGAIIIGKGDKLTKNDDTL